MTYNDNEQKKNEYEEDSFIFDIFIYKLKQQQLYNKSKA